jgi:SAM-dependent methyltransferase
MMLLDKHKRDWDELGELDPFWAVLSDPSRRFGRWDVKEFFETGEVEIQQLLSVADQLGYPAARIRALDFGCGVGRLTRALAGHFQECTGVDISASMVAKARELSRSLGNCSFVVNEEVDLSRFSDDSFDFVLTKQVLQHLPSKKAIENYIREFVRVLKKDGLLVFQLPCFIPIRNRLQFRRRIWACLRMVGFRHDYVYQKLHLHPIRMNYVPEEKVCRMIEFVNAKLVLIRPDPREPSEPIVSATYFVTK